MVTAGERKWRCAAWRSNCREGEGQVAQYAVMDDLPLTLDKAKISVVVARLDWAHNALNPLGALRPATNRLGVTASFEHDELGIEMRPVLVDLNEWSKVT
jgi:hypothetical protein